MKKLFLIIFALAIPSLIAAPNDARAAYYRKKMQQMQEHPYKPYTPFKQKKGVNIFSKKFYV